MARCGFLPASPALPWKGETRDFEVLLRVVSFEVQSFHILSQGTHEDSSLEGLEHMDLDVDSPLTLARRVDGLRRMVPNPV